VNNSFLDRSSLAWYQVPRPRQYLGREAVMDDAPIRPGRGSSSRAVCAAFAVSLVLHLALLLCFGLPPNTNDRPSGRVGIGAEMKMTIDLAWDPNDPGKKRKGEEEPQEVIPVRIDMTPSRAGEGDAGPGPMILPPTHVAGGAGGKEGSTTGVGSSRGFYGVTSSAKRVVFVLDSSISMGLSGSFRAAKAEIVRVLRGFPAETCFQVILYNESAEPLRIGRGERLLPADAATLRAVEGILAEARPSGETDHAKALSMALSLDPEVIYLVTDADDLTPAVVKDVTRRNREHVVIHTIDVGRRLQATGRLRELASQNGGQYVRAVR
jgi:hypothetical protein